MNPLLRSQRLWLGICCLLTVACAGRAVRTPEGLVPAVPRGIFLPPDEFPSQHLLRLRYSGPEGNGSARVVLRLLGRGKYQIRLGDRLGRPVWALATEDGRSHFADFRGRKHCRRVADGEAEFLQLEGLPFGLADLPSLLLGYLPDGLVPLSSGRRQSEERVYIDRWQREWRVGLRDGAVESWMIFAAGERVVWWLREESGGVLSHADGVQVRWRQVVRETLIGDALQIDVPPGFAELGCDEMPVLRFDTGTDDS